MTHFFSFRGKFLDDSIKEAVLTGLRHLLFGMAGQFRSTIISDINKQMNSPLWVLGPIPNTLLDDAWLTPVKTAERRGVHR